MDQELSEQLGIWLSKLGVAVLVGAVVAATWWSSTRRRPRTQGLGGTLLMLAVLICFVTAAVGTNTAVAFTLVGTLAIVRFRTAVRDIRDTAFVIFAVAVGIAASTVAAPLAILSTLAVAMVALVLNAIFPDAGGSSEDIATQSPWRLQLRFDSDAANAVAIEQCLQAQTSGWQLLQARGSREDGARQLYAVLVDTGHAGTLVSSLQQLPGMRRVTLSSGEAAADDS